VDYWALGVLIYEMVTGYSPFAGEEAPEQMAIFRNIIRVKVVGEWTCSPPCKGVIQSLCTKEVHQRLLIDCSISRLTLSSLDRCTSG
jgi:serine/threonine protein kinase